MRGPLEGVRVGLVRFLMVVWGVIIGWVGIKRYGV